MQRQQQQLAIGNCCNQQQSATAQVTIAAIYNNSDGNSTIGIGRQQPIEAILSSGIFLQTVFFTVNTPLTFTPTKTQSKQQTQRSNQKDTTINWGEIVVGRQHYLAMAAGAMGSDCQQSVEKRRE